jgi:hypothetical protein
MEPLPKKSVWAMFGLNIITLGIYLAIWFWTRRDAFNRLNSGRKISPMPALLLLIANILSVGLLILWFCCEDTLVEKQINQFDRLLNILIALTFLLQSFNLRKMLADHYNIKLSWLATFIFRFYYIQYKINRLSSELGGHPSINSGQAILS